MNEDEENNVYPEKVNKRKEKNTLIDSQDEISEIEDEVIQLYDFDDLKDRLIKMLEKHNKVLNEKGTLSVANKKTICEENLKLLNELRDLEPVENRFDKPRNSNFIELMNTVKDIQKDLKVVKKQTKIVNNDSSNKSSTNSEDRLCVIEPGQKTYADVCNELNRCKLVEDKIRTDSVYTTKNNLIVVKTRSKEDRDKLIDNCKEIGLTARNTKDKLHRFVLKRLPCDKDDNEIINDILSRRLDGTILKQSFKLVKTFKAKNGLKVFVFNVNSEGAKLINDEPDFYLDLVRHRASKYVQLIQCYKCFGFNHIAKNCPNEEVCGKCAHNHVNDEERNQCNENSNMHNCINCLNEGKNGANTHVAVSNLCPIKQEHRKRAVDCID